MTPASTPRPKLVTIWACLLLALFVTYSNHFHNSFHFDDGHTIEQNPYIRDLRNIPLFFTDARTFSVLPVNQSYRPLVTTSLAVDYWVQGGVKPFWFHVSTFGWYVVLLVSMYALFVRIIKLTSPGPVSRYVALFAVAWYGLHPVSAETVNYINQRADLYATLGVVAGLVAYAALPGLRNFGLYLVPVLFGLLAKQSALAFAPLLLLYIVLYETGSSRHPKGRARAIDIRSVWDDLWLAVRRSAPAFVLCGAYYLFQRAMTPPTFTPGARSAVRYWLTQPSVLLHYVRAFFWPTDLSADTDRMPVDNVFSEPVVIGVVFLVAYGFALVYTWRRTQMRPVAFGLSWFLIASAPTSLFPLAEVENDHRMFFPFVGLTLALCWAGWLWLESRWDRIAAKRLGPAVTAGVAFGLLVAYAWGAHARNEVWRTEETLWRDVTIKSPRNGRGLMNYGITLMGRGDYHGALRYFHSALTYTPDYSLLHINLGIAYAGVGNDREAENHFRRALSLAPDYAGVHYYYARWFHTRGRVSEALGKLKEASTLNSAFMDSRYLAMQIYAEQNDVVELKRLAGETLRLFPGDRISAEYLAAASDSNRLSVLRRSVSTPAAATIQDAELAVRQTASPEALLNLSLHYWQAGRHEDCIRAAKQALKLRPEYAEAYNNIAAAYQSMGRWDEAIEAAQQALRIKPDFQLARNNLAYAASQKALALKSRGQTE